MAKKAVALLLALSLMLCFVSCDNPEPAATPTPTQQETPANTPSITPDASVESPPYAGMNTGSSKKLLGNCVLINIFLFTENSSFSTEQKQETMNRLKEMDHLLNKEIEKYSQDLTLIYNSEDLSIDYSIETIPKGNYWGYDIISEIYSLYDIDHLSQKYKADNVSFLFNINKRDWSYSCTDLYGSNTYYNEFAIMYTDFPSAERLYAYTHEVLHLFGAVDLYYSSDIEEGKKDQRKKLAALATEYCPNEIMLVRPDMNQPIVSNLTAYLIGWTNCLEEKYEVFLEEYKFE